MSEQIQKVQNKIREFQGELEQKKVVASSKRGEVTVTINGKQQLLGIEIDKNIVNPNEVEKLEQLVLSTVNQGLAETSKIISTSLSKVTGDLRVPDSFG